MKKAAENWIFPIILFLWPLVNCAGGIEISDSTYSLANDLFLKPDYMWYFATFLAGRAGTLMMRLPGGAGILAMNIKSGLLVSLMAAGVYLALKRRIPAPLLFAAEWTAVSVFWSPYVSLYNTLSYALLTFSCILLLKAMEGRETGKKELSLYFAAGVLLGLNVFVRVSNITQAALIAAVVWNAYLEKENARAVRSRIAACVGGFAAGAGACFLYISVRHGAGAWPAAVFSLFGITESAEDYSAGGMLDATLSAYRTSLKWFALMAVPAAAGSLVYAFGQRKKLWEKKAPGTAFGIFYAAGILVLIRFFYGRGMFTVNYRDYWCMFQWAMLGIILTILLSVLDLLGVLPRDKEESVYARTCAALVIILILILPLGSNNYTFPVLLAFAVILPYTLWGLNAAAKAGKRELLPMTCMAAAVMLMLLVQGTVFHVQYAFRDGTDGTKRTAYIEHAVQAEGGISSLTEGVKTTPANAAVLGELIRYMEDSGLCAGSEGAIRDILLQADDSESSRKLISYGTAPGLSYLLLMEPALPTAWPDLDSYPYEEFERALAAAGEGAGKEALPVIILHADGTDDLDRLMGRLPEKTQGESEGGGDPAGSIPPSGKKAALLGRFIEDNGYSISYENEAFRVYTALPGKQ